jgi:hypothetical protein
MPFKELDDYKDCHKGGDIYILASGPSFDYIDPVFLSDKITIGINEIYKRFKPTYLIRKDPSLLKQSLSENPSTPHFISKGKFGDNNIENKMNLEKDESLANMPIVIFDHEPNQKRVPAQLPKSGLVVSYSTITTAIHLAAHMGAKTILLIGHDCGTLDSKVNCANYYTDQTYSLVWKQNGEADYRRWVLEIEAHTIALKKLIKDAYGCSIHSINPFINFNLEGHKYSKSGQ